MPDGHFHPLFPSRFAVANEPSPRTPPELHARHVGSLLARRRGSSGDTGLSRAVSCRHVGCVASVSVLWARRCWC